MKNLFIIISLVFISILSHAAPQYRVYRVNGQNVLIPVEKEKKELKGVGMTLTNTINFETEKDAKGVEVKKAWLWIGGCGKTYIKDDEKIFSIKQGTNIRIRMTGEGRCNIQSWEIVE